MNQIGYFHNFISLEGIDFTWKTPFSQWLNRDLTAQGNRVLLTRDPPYFISPWDEFVDIFERGDKLTRMAEAHLLLTARLDNFERIIAPALKDNHIVIADRYADSWLAYQSVRQEKYFGGRAEVLDFLIFIQDRLVNAGLLGLPGLTIWISDDPNITIKRAATAAKISKYENLPLQIEVDKQYQLLSERFSSRIHSVNARNLDIHATYAQILSIVTDYFRK